MGRDQHLRVNMPKLMFNKIRVPDGLDQIIENSVHHIDLGSYGRDTDRIPQTMRKASCVLGPNSISFYSGVNSDSIISENLHFSIQLADSRIFSHNKILQKWNRFDEPVKITPVSRKYLLPGTDYSLQAIRNENHIELGLRQYDDPPIVLGFYQDDKLVDLRSFDYFAAQPEDWILEVLLEKPRNITQLEELYNSLFHEMEETYSKIRSEFEEKGFDVQDY